MSRNRSEENGANCVEVQTAALTVSSRTIYVCLLSARGDGMRKLGPNRALGFVTAFGGRSRCFSRNTRSG